MRWHGPTAVVDDLFRSGVDGASDWEVAAEVDRTAAVRRRLEADQPLPGARSMASAQRQKSGSSS